MDANDAELVQRTRQGDLEAFGRLYDRHVRLVRALCADATHDLATAQDLAQDVFLRAFERLAGLREPSHFGAWVVGIARLMAKEWLRRQARDRHRFSAEIDDATAPARDDADARLAKLLHLLAELPEMERLAIHAFYLAGQNADDSARALGLSRSGFYKLLDSARRRLALRYRRTQEEVR